ncbi:hypothetical protein A9Q98_14215 [Thalassotalea sp. 42_200_T64]|nr:hypothetical protein A9Q98_14215 [Thalassotalea sp. 42_200_T64]
MLRNLIFILCCCWLLASKMVLAKGTTNSQPDKPVLRIGTMHAPPFAIKAPDGSWSGISIELWQAMAKDLNLSYQFEEHSLQGLLDGVNDGSLHAAVAAITITEERESLMDFTHPIHSTGFAIATKSDEQTNLWLSTFQQLFSLQFFQVVASLFGLLFAVGWLMWLVEHKHEAKSDDSHTIRRVSEGFWWAAATMTTVGYGDKTPLTTTGRALGVVWMFTALIIVASFIAAFSSILTLQKISSNVNNINNLSKVQIATVPGSTSERFLKNNGYMTHEFPSVSDGISAVANGKIDAMVYDAPLLRYFVQEEFQGLIEISPVTFERQDYGFAVPENSQLREPLNRILLRIVRSDNWNVKLEKYMGK